MENNKRTFHKRVVIGLLLFMCSLGLFAAVAHEVIGEQEDVLDMRILHAVKDYSGNTLIAVMRVISFFGSHLFLFPATLILLVVLAIKKKWTDCMLVGIMSLSSFVLMLFLKNYFHRDRPNVSVAEVINNFSFPSGHTMSFFVFALLLIYLVLKSRYTTRTKVVSIVLLLIASLLVGISRIILRVHYASDVLAGFSLAVAWSVFISFLVTNYSSITGRRHQKHT